MAHAREITKRAEQVLENMDPVERTKLQNTIKIVHTNFGHPANASLARAIRLQGGSEEAIAAAEAHRCVECERRRPVDLDMPVDLKADVKEFGDLVCTDLMQLSDAKGNATQLQMATATSPAKTAVFAAGSSAHLLHCRDRIT